MCVASVVASSSHAWTNNGETDFEYDLAITGAQLWGNYLTLEFPVGVHVKAAYGNSLGAEVKVVKRF